MKKRKARIETADNGWVVILLEGSEPQGNKFVFQTWSDVDDAVRRWLNPRGLQ